MSGGGIRRVEARAFRVPTDPATESDGTLEWSSTTMVAVWVDAEARTGFGYTYSADAAAGLLNGPIAEAVRGMDATRTGAVGRAAMRALRNAGRPGLAACALSALDLALWDWKGKRLGQPVAELLPLWRDRVPVYGSGGFTSMDARQVHEQFACWADAGIDRVKMKVGRDPPADAERVRAARDAIGPGGELYVDANGAWTPKRALAHAHALAGDGVSWLEEPVSSDDLDGLRLVRERGPAGMDVAAGEYGYTPWYFRRMVAAGAVDCLQADVTRCGGLTGFLQVAALCEASHLDLSSHTAPAVSAVACAAAPRLRHLEWFHDHVRLERLLLDGFPEQAGGEVRPPALAPGLGLELKDTDAERYAA